MAGKQGSINGFNAVGAGQTMKIEEGIHKDIARPGGGEQYSSAPEAGSAIHGDVRAAGSIEEYRTAAEDGNTTYPRPGGASQIKES